MTIPLTVVSPERSADLVLPAHVPLAVLADDLAELTGHDSPRLSTVSGRVLDPTLGLQQNGVDGGAVLLASAAEQRAPVIDDIAELADAQQTATGAAQHVRAGGSLLGPGLALVVPLIAGFALHSASVSLVSLVTLAVVALWALLPRLVLRACRLEAATDPAGAGVAQRLSAARAGALRLERACAGVILVGGLVLATQSELRSQLAGWCALLVIALRAGGDSLIAIAVVAACAPVLLNGAAGSTTLHGGLLIAGAIVITSALRGGGRGPFVRVLRQATERISMVLLPVGLLAASGMLRILGA